MDYIKKNNITWCEPIYNHYKNMNNTMKGKVRPMTCCVDIKQGVDCIKFVMPTSICVNSCSGDNLKDILKELKTTILKEFSFIFNDVDFYSVGNCGEIYHYNDLLEE